MKKRSLACGLGVCCLTLGWPVLSRTPALAAPISALPAQLPAPLTTAATPDDFVTSSIEAISALPASGSARLHEILRETPDGPQAIWVLRIPAGAGQLRVVRAEPQPDGRPALEPVSRMATRLGALAAVNAGYFSPRDRIPLGLVAVGGQLVAGPLYRRSALVVAPGTRFDRPQVQPWVRLPGGESAEVDALNLLPQADNLVLFTPAWGPRTGTQASNDSFEAALTADGQVLGTGASDLGIPPGGFVLAATGSRGRWLADRLQRGDRLAVQAGLDEYWGPVTEAIGGGPLLVRDGTASVAQDERFRPDIMQGRNARTAVGLCPDGTVLLVSVEAGDRASSIGMTLGELAAFLVERGATTAMNLDGGSSTTFWAEGSVLNRPSGGTERSVATALVVLPPLPDSIGSR